MSKYDDLKKIKEMYDEGILTESEYETEKAKILANDTVSDAPKNIDPQSAQQPSQIIINNTNTNANSNTASVQATGNAGKQKNKWVALILCVLMGLWGAHKFYEGKIFLGVVYLFTFGLLGFGTFIDFFIILCKPNPYYC